MLRKEKTQKGIIMYEILISLCLMILVSGIVTVLLTYVFDSNERYSNNTIQQGKISRAINLLRTDIEKSKTVTLVKDPSGNITSVKIDFPDAKLPAVTELSKEWSFDTASNTLKYVKGTNTNTAVDGIMVKDAKSGANKSYFYYDGNKNLVLMITPVSLNKGKYDGVNIKNPIVTEYSLKYKEVK